MKKLCFVILTLVAWLIPNTVFGQLSHTVKFSKTDADFTTITGDDIVQYQRISFVKSHYSGEIGQPELPERYIRLIVPANQDMGKITVNSLKQEIVTGEYLIYPVQHPVPISMDDIKPDFVRPNLSVYSSDITYPEQCVKVVRDDYFDGSNHIVTVAVYPYQYMPKSRKLIFNSLIDFTLKMKSGKSKSIHVRMRNEKQQKIYDQILKHTVDNPEMIDAYRTIPPLRKSEAIGSINQLPFYDYVIITSNALKPSFNAFVSWKKRKGIQVGIITTEEIYAEYSGD